MFGPHTLIAKCIAKYYVQHIHIILNPTALRVHGHVHIIEMRSNISCLMCSSKQVNALPGRSV